MEFLFFFVFVCMIVWLIMSYSELGNFEFFLLFIIFLSYLVYLLMNKKTSENFIDVDETTPQPQPQNDVINKIKLITSLIGEVKEEDRVMSKVIGDVKEEDKVLSNEIKVVEEEQQNISSSISNIYTKVYVLIQDLQKFPGEMKHRFGSELDRLINNVTPLSPTGEFVNYVSIDSNYFNPPHNMNSSQSDFYTKGQSIQYNVDEMKKISHEYMLIDKVFRDLYYVDKDRYNKIFYN